MYTMDYAGNRLEQTHMDANAAKDEPLLLVIDEFAELLLSEPNVESTLRAVWEEVGPDSKLRVLLTGSAVRAMKALQAERAPVTTTSPLGCGRR